MKRLIISSLILTFLSFASEAFAGVTGNCDVCHTMHNSQDGASLVTVGTTATTYAGWNASNQLVGGGDSSSQKNLLVSNCVGCHSSSTNETIININGVRIPIVFNTNSAPTNPLAGGNFYWMVNGGGTQAELDARGHNVRGISALDSKLSSAPGTVGCADSCHVSLTLTDADTYNNLANGCQGCHQGVNHHSATQPAGDPPGDENGGYRFLHAPSGHFVGAGRVLGIEDDDWEQTNSSTDHNVYYGGTGDDNETPESIGKYCAGCHYGYHSDGDKDNIQFWPLNPAIRSDGQTYTYNGGDDDYGDPWFRHPADALIPDEGEYAGVQTYSVTVPVARSEGEATIKTVSMDRFEPGSDKVMCLSCHRAHGSPYPDMLRWDYDAMETGTSGAEAGNGCFKCHKNKDGV